MKKIIITLAAMLTLSSVSGQIVNPGFENWVPTSTAGSLKPAGWSMYGTNKLLSGSDESYCQQASPAIDGSYSLVISIWYYYVKSLAFQKTAIAYRPLSLTGLYKYTDNEEVYGLGGESITDTAMVYVALTKWNTLTTHTDTIGYGQLPLFAAAASSPFSCPISYTSAAIPDSITVMLDPSIVRRYQNSTYFQTHDATGKSSYLTIDKLALSDVATGINNITENSFTIYPNPAADNLIIHTPGKGPYNVNVTNMMGSSVYSTAAGGNDIAIPLHSLPAGNYFIALQGHGADVVVRKMLVKR